MTSKYSKMKKLLHDLSYIDHEEHGPMYYIYSDSSKLIDQQSQLMKTMYSKFSALIRNHFSYQQSVINQSMKPFLPKIATAKQLLSENMTKFSQERELKKDEVKLTSGLFTLEKKWLEAQITDPEMK